MSERLEMFAHRWQQKRRSTTSGIPDQPRQRSRTPPHVSQAAAHHHPQARGQLGRCVVPSMPSTDSGFKRRDVCSPKLLRSSGHQVQPTRPAGTSPPVWHLNLNCCGEVEPTPGQPAGGGLCLPPCGNDGQHIKRCHRQRARWIRFTDRGAGTTCAQLPCQAELRPLRTKRHRGCFAGRAMGASCQLRSTAWRFRTTAQIPPGGRSSAA